MAYSRPQSNYTSQRGRLAAYQYRNMNRYVPTQVKRWSQAKGNAYGAANWRVVDVNRQRQAYWEHATMKRLGGDLSLRDRMMAEYYAPKAHQGWEMAGWQPGLEGWMRRRLQGKWGATGREGVDYVMGGMPPGSGTPPPPTPKWKTNLLIRQLGFDPNDPILRKQVKTTTAGVKG